MSSINSNSSSNREILKLSIRLQVDKSLRYLKQLENAFHGAWTFNFKVFLLTLVPPALGCILTYTMVATSTAAAPAAPAAAPAVSEDCALA